MHKKDIIEITVTGILGVVLLFVLLHAFHGKKPPQPIVTANLSGAQSVPLKQEAGPAFFTMLEEKTKAIEVTRDPFFPIPLKESLNVDSAPKLILNGILIDEGVPKAMINDAIVVKGDKINGHTVVEIKKDRVTLNDGTHDIDLTMGDPFSKK